MRYMYAHMKDLVISQSNSNANNKSPLARGACYHFGTGIPFVSMMQCTTPRVCSKRELFIVLTSINIARDHHNRIIHRFIEL